MTSSVPRTPNRLGDITFDLFLDGHLNDLARYARVLTHDREQAHDCLADCLIRVQQRWPRIAEMEQPVAYIRKMIANTVISSNRRWSNRNIQITATGELPETCTEDKVSAIDQTDELQQMLSSLTTRQRAMVVMRFYLDWTDAAIAAELGCSEVTVRSSISRALLALRTRPAAPEAAVEQRPAPRSYALAHSA